MADLIYSRNIFDGGRKLVHSIVDVSDGTGYSAQMIDVGNLNTNAQGALCNRINLQKLWFNSNLAAAANPIRIQWNVGGGTNIDLLTLGEGSDSYDFTSFGGITNSEAASASGDVWSVIPPAIVSGEGVTIVSEWIKTYV